MKDEEQLATIKKPGEVEKITDEEFQRRALEIARCKRDIVYFAEKYYRIINLDKGLHIIKLYDIQKEFLRFLVNNNKIVCVSGRQQGKCLFRTTNIILKNKKTGEIQQMQIEKFFNMIKQKQIHNS